MNNISKKFIFIFIMIIIIVSFGIGIFLYLLESTQLIDSLKGEANITSKRLVKSLEIPIWDIHLETIESIIDVEMKSDPVIGILIKDQGQILGGKILNQKMEIVNWTEVKKQKDNLPYPVYLVKTENIIKNDRNIGTMEIYFTDYFIQQELKQVIYILILAITVLTTVVTSAILIIVNTIILKPINLIDHALSSFEGEDFSVALSIKTNDEFERIGKAFNQMTDQIKKSRIQLLEKEKLKNELEIAQKIQTMLLPAVPEHPELQIDAVMLPAEDVGGDYYDISYDNKKNLWFAIGDVSGHGVTPGLVMMMAETSFISHIKDLEDISPKDAIIKVNRILHENIRGRLKKSHFMTMTFLEYTWDGGFVYSGVHVDIIIFRDKTKKCEFVKTRGIYLGLVPDIQTALEDETFHIEPEDILILYTDGIIEAKNEQDELFTPTQLAKVVEDNAQLSVTELKNTIVSQTLKWCNGRQKDDITLIVAKRIRQN
ncbi:MAG: SpoIIE family protein phosphatase [Spirochaetes bacterium]|nr:SpoIIE family protein phosphatase [Spirochaetota bacterium]